MSDEPRPTTEDLKAGLDAAYRELDVLGYADADERDVCSFCDVADGHAADCPVQPLWNALNDLWYALLRRQAEEAPEPLDDVQLGELQDEQKLYWHGR